ncbi:AAA family ATPase [Halosegnis longus]|uniref:AAA family ATPase n=1 Tax=Halosegnis longus TaxID=2216012 RepID=UPI00096A658B|nr:AAA family ATPase [Salella cibi]
MIENGAVLDTDTTREEVIVERSEPFQTLVSTLSRYLNKGGGRGAFITGPSGAGKTMLAERLQEQLRRERMAMESAYVNVWEYSSTSEVLVTALDEVGRHMNYDQRGTPHAELRRLLREAHDDPLLLVLDEVHQIEEPALVGQFLRMDGVFTVLICNDRFDLTRRLDRTSRVSGLRHVHLEAYRAETIERILRERIEFGLESGSVTDEFVLEVAALVEGDARLAIEALGVGVDDARSNNVRPIPGHWAEGAVDEAREIIRQRPLSRLNQTQRAIYEELLDCGGWVQMGTLDERLMARGIDVSRQTIRRHLDSLDHYNLCEQKGQTKGKRYRCVTG